MEVSCVFSQQHHLTPHILTLQWSTDFVINAELKISIKALSKNHLIYTVLTNSSVCLSLCGFFSCFQGPLPKWLPHQPIMATVESNLWGK